MMFFFFQAEDGIRDRSPSRGLGDVYKRQDTGCGIAKEDIDKIWDRFYKSDSSRGRDKKGSGLGLSITKEVIQAHGENIDVVSTVGVGTEFIFTLELAK